MIVKLGPVLLVRLEPNSFLRTNGFFKAEILFGIFVFEEYLRIHGCSVHRPMKMRSVDRSKALCAHRGVVGSLILRSSLRSVVFIELFPPKSSVVLL